MTNTRKHKLVNLYDIPDYFHVDYFYNTYKDGYKVKFRRYILCNELTPEKKNELKEEFTNINFTTCQYRYASEQVYDVLEVYDVQLSTIEKRAKAFANSTAN